MLLYDLTSTLCRRRSGKESDGAPRLFEGSQARLRATGDCAHCEQRRLLFSYETFDFNRADVSTMETILRVVERKYGKARRI